MAKKVVVVLEPGMDDSKVVANDEDIEVYLVIKGVFDENHEAHGIMMHAKAEHDTPTVEDWTRTIERMKARAKYQSN